jgi:hypothetical protein
VSRDWRSIDAARQKKTVVATEDAVQNLPPGYIAGFNCTLSSGKATVGPGVAVVKGKRVDMPSTLITEDHFPVSKTGLGTGVYYYVYLTTESTYWVTTQTPVWSDEWFYDAHPTESHRVVARLFVDSDDVITEASRRIGQIEASDISSDAIKTLLIQAAFAWLGFSGNGAWGSPEAGDRRVYIDGDEITFAEYINGAWATFNQIKLGGTDSNGNFLPFLQCRGIIHPSLGDDYNGDFLPAPEYLLYDFENDQLDQFGVALADPFTAFAFDSGKIGTYSITGSGTSGGWDRAAVWESLSEAQWTPGSSQSFGHWRKISAGFKTMDAADTNLAILGSEGATADSRIALWITTDGYAEVRLHKAYASPYTADETITGDVDICDVEWHFIGVTYDATTDKLYLVVDENVYSSSEAIGGTWTAYDPGQLSDFQFRVHETSSTYYQTWVDDLVIAPDIYVPPDLWASHAIHETAWNTEASGQDVVLAPQSGGRVRPSYGLSVPFMGFLHMLEVDSRTDGYDITDTSIDDTWEEGDLSALLPAAYLHSIRWVRCRIQMTSTDTKDTAIICARHKGSSATVGQSYLLRLVAEIGASGVGMGASGMVDIPVRDGIFEYRRYSADHPVSSLNVQLWGYYV